MRKFLQLAAMILAATALIWWLAAGPNRGWTKTSVPVKTVDEVTGLEGLAYREQFVPGVDFLGAGLLAAAVLGGLSFVFRKPKTSNPTE